ncbi:MAG TPA: hypothetical protein VMT17_17545 [Anaeromyxobacteraceae bacterium]|nr:hypothetical protein [Anaeromyxobacteraceae bacterium]
MPALLAAVAVAAGSGTPVGASELVRRCVEAYGGRPALERFPAMVQEGVVKSGRRGDGRLTRIFERRRRLRVSIAYADGPGELRVLDGSRGWRDGEEVTGGPAYLAMVLQAARLDLPLVLLSLPVADEGTVERGGATLRALSVPLGEGLSLTAEIDPRSGEVRRVVTRMAGPMGAVEFATEFGDFRKVSGVLVPFRETTFAQGQRTGETVLESVELLREAPTGAFRP